jgi:hypothetical protein
MIATAFETRSANLASLMNMNGIAIRNVERKLSKQRPRAPIQSRFVSLGRPGGSGNRFTFCRVNSSCSWDSTDANSGGSASAMIRCAVLRSCAFRIAPSVSLTSLIVDANQQINASVNDSLFF